MLNDREKADGTHTHAMGMDAIIITSCYAYGCSYHYARRQQDTASTSCSALHSPLSLAMTWLGRNSESPHPPL